MRIALDVMGGDHGPAVAIDGVSQALRAPDHERIQRVLLVGREEEIRPLLQQHGVVDPRVEVRHASEVLTMDDKPIEGLRRKKDCSVLRAVELVKAGDADAVISQGNTGGLVAAAQIRLRRLEGVDRPAITCIMPGLNGSWVLLDAGANPEATAEHLAHNAVMGAVYARAMLGIKQPRVGLLCNGTEEIKGTEITRAALRLCRALDLNFAGYVEGPDVFLGNVDVAVTDGFVGNIVLKTIEGMGKAIQTILRSELTANPVRKLGALIASGGLRSIKQRMNPDAYGGAQILGLNGNVIKVHGSAKPVVIANAIRQTTNAFRIHLNDSILTAMRDANARLEALGPAPAAAAD